MRKRILSLWLAMVFAVINSCMSISTYAQNQEECILGNTSENILNGGVIALDGDKIYYADILRNGQLYVESDGCEELLSTDDCKNINLVDDIIYYSTEIENKPVIKKIDNDGISVVYEPAESSLKQMYIVNSTHIYYLTNTGIYLYDIDTQDKENVLSIADIDGFVPTEYGIIYATGTQFDYDIYADGKLITEGVSIYYTDEEYLIFHKDTKDYQISIENIFNHSSADEYIENFTGIAQSEYNLFSSNGISLDDNIEYLKDTSEYVSETTSTIMLLSAENLAEEYGYADYPVKLMSTGVDNIIKRARQQLEIQWTPLADVKSFGSSTTFYAGTTYTGMPYGQPVSTGKYVPHSASFSDFKNAVNDSRSVFYTSRGSSDSPYYSSDCSAFVSWSYGLTRMTTSTISTSSLFTTISTSSIYSAQVGDCLNKIRVGDSSGHARLIGGIGYDSSGNMSSITIMEQTTPNARTITYTPAQLQTIMTNEGYTLKRYNNRDSVEYYPDSNVPLEDEPSPVDLGTDFYAVILNKEVWKPITYDEDGYVRLRTENGSANQVWFFRKESDGAYTITSTKDNKLLELTEGDTTSGKPVTVGSEDWGGYYQRWYIYEQDGGYIIQSKHYPDLNLVLDLSENNSDDGTSILTYTKNNTSAQIFSIYKGDDIKLSSPQLSARVENDVAIFKWNDVYGESAYDLTIKKNGDDYKVIRVWSGSECSCSELLDAGSYTACVTALNAFYGMDSDSISFNISCNLGNEFYATVSHKESGKVITYDEDCYVRIRSDEQAINQIWFFERQSDSSYTIASAKDNKLLELTEGDTTSGKPVTVGSEDWGGYYQRWYIYEYNGGYIIHSKHFDNLNLVLDVSDNSTEDGTSVLTYYRNNTFAQIFSVSQVEKPTETTTPTTSPTATPTPTEASTACFKVTQYDGYADVENTDSQARSVAVIIAKYNGNALKKASLANVTFASGEKRTFMLDSDGTYKIFVWDSINSMLPLDV